MKITYRGGFDKNDPQQKDTYVLPDRAESVKQTLSQNKKIAVVTYAKPDGYYDENIRTYFGTSVDIINTKTKHPAWDTYDFIYLLGGNQLQLHKELLRNAYSLDALKDDVHIVGDSAGAMVSSAYFYWIEDGKKVVFHEGLNPDSHLITIVHADNESYSPAFLFEEVQTFAQKHNLEILELKENQEVTR